MATDQELRLQLADLERRCEMLKTAERHAREVAAAERRRADAAEAATRRAWQLASWRKTPDLTGRGSGGTV